jgi:hypothetical protein
MISYIEASLNLLSIHKTGNKAADEMYRLSEEPYTVADDVLGKLLMQYFLSAFEKVNELYSFYHPANDLQLNEVYHFATAIFSDVNSFHENSKQLVRHLYDMSAHPKIKSGELYITLFKNLQIEGELHEAIGIFKSETKEPFLKVITEADGYSFTYEQEAINIKKLDKGCLIFNTDEAEGYKVVVIDQTNRNSDAVYWTDEFLKLKVRNNHYQQTNATLSIYKNFITQQAGEQFDLSKTDQIDLLNRSMNYFKEKDTFDINEFSTEVIGNPDGIQAFKEYKTNYEEEYETSVKDSFPISDAAVKKQARVYKSILKLDKNFHIYIHGNKDLIEKGFDEERNMNYYKVYFRDEQ